MWTDGNGFFYSGDCRVGDRAATEQEVAHWLESIKRIPTSVEIRKAIKIMRKYGILEPFLSLLSAMPGQEGENARTDWERSSRVDVNNPTFQLGVQLLGLTSQQVVDMFVEADALP